MTLNRWCGSGSGLDQRAVGTGAIEKLFRVAVKGEPVGSNGLKHEGGGVRAVGVAAGATAAETVAIDLVDDVATPVGGDEGRGVDGASESGDE